MFRTDLKPDVPLRVRPASVGGILFLGEAPSRASDPSDPLGGPCMRRLARLAGLSEEELRRRASFANLLDAWPGRRFPVNKGIDVAQMLRERLPRPDVLVMLGLSVARCFYAHEQAEFEPFLEWWDERGFVDAYVIPHPSGRSLWWNEPHNRARYASFLHNLFALEEESCLSASSP